MKIGEILVKAGAATPQQIQQALAVQRERSGTRLGALLVEQGVVTPEQVAQALSEQSGLEYVALKGLKVPSDIVEMVPRDLAEAKGLLPLSCADGAIRVAIADPFDIATLDELRFRLNLDVQPVLSSLEEIRTAITHNYGINASEEALETLTEMEGGEAVALRGEGEEDRIDESGDDAPVIRLVTWIIAEAVKGRASDIHIEPFEKRIRVRYRIDGVCTEIEQIKPPKRLQASVISRIKIMAKMQIEEKRKPQDGQIKMNIMGRALDLRVSVIPGTWGESVVMRILEKQATSAGLPNLGFLDDDYQKFNQIIKRPNGIILVCGPTGSGKTTTLNAALTELNRPDVKIITAEDPVEYHVSGINQSQVNEAVGLTFARIIRAMLRQAPNIIMIGEIRDVETAESAIEAALTGHLVFSTIHTNDAPSAITRLIDMGIKPFLVGSSIQAILGQRLVRVICQHCKESYLPTDKEYFALGLKPQEVSGKPLYRGRGCAECNQTGYKGRKGIFELLLLTRRIRELAMSKAPTTELRAEARNSGMRPLREDGIRKVLNGMTTMDEVNRETHMEVGPA